MPKVFHVIRIYAKNNSLQDKDVVCLTEPKVKDEVKERAVELERRGLV